MKLNRNLANRLIVSTVALLVVASAYCVSAQAPIPGAAKVLRIKGAARYTAGDNKWHPLSEGDVIKPGSVIQTASASQLDMLLADDDSNMSRSIAPTMSYQPGAEARANIVRMFENTVLSVDKLTTIETGADRVTETQLDLRNGKIFGTVKKQTAASRYEVKIPNGVAGIRGTVYTISASGIVSVLSGTVIVAFTKPDGTVITQVVTGGQQYDVNSGLLSAIPNYDKQSMITAAKEAGIGATGPMTAFSPNVGVYYVSPTIGATDGGGNGGNGGGGNGGD